MSAPVFPIKWSHSSLKLFSNCPKRYYHEREVGDVESVTHESASYGKAVHEIIENYSKEGDAEWNEHHFIKPYIDTYLNLPGEKYPEYDLSLRSDYSPCKYDDDDAWYRGFADLCIINGEKKRGYVVDYKTGNPRWADPDQLEIYALAMFRHFPQIDEVRGMLDFLAQDVTIPRKFLRSEAEARWLTWISKLERIQRAKENSNWPATSSGLCKVCPVSHCVNHPSWRTSTRGTF